MKTIKIIDLINKIVNKEEVPKKIKYDRKIWIYEDKCQDYSYEKNGITEKFLLQEIMSGIDSTINCLNYELEIIKESIKIEKIEKIDLENFILTRKSQKNIVLANKLNEVIDVVNELKRGN